jgi:hypothetical protein
MAVNINTVYTTVLYILNKEQRGYITPSEFNSLAVQVQNEIFESYFPNGNQLNRQNQNNTQNDTEFFNMFKDTAYKLYPFERDASFTYNTINGGWYFNNLNLIFKIGEIISTYNGQPQNNSITQLVSKKDFDKITRSKLTAPTKKYPIAFTTQSTSNITPFSNSVLLLKVDPLPDSLNVNCVFKPTDPQWGFTPGAMGQYIYSPATSVDFELDISEQTNLITNILKYAGVVVNDATVIQVAEQEAKSVEINTKS